MTRFKKLQQYLCVVSLCEHVHLPTSGAALADDNAQSVAHCESQIRTFVNSHTEYTGNAFEGCQQVDGTRTEAREHGPDLKEEYTHALLNNSFTETLYSE